MNQRIKELAEQIYGSAHYDDFKFAELIIKECMLLIILQSDATYVSDYIAKHSELNERQGCGSSTTEYVLG